MTSWRTLGGGGHPRGPLPPASGTEALARPLIGAPVTRERWGLGVCWGGAGNALLGPLGGRRGASGRCAMTSTPRARHTALVGHGVDLPEGVD